jgi:hypothetical protein
MSTATRFGLPGAAGSGLWLWLAGLLAMVGVLLTACGGADTPESTAGKAGEADSGDDSITIVQYGHDSVTVLDLLLEQHTADVQHTERGAFVSGIDGIASGSGAFWLYSVNDTMGSVAADQRRVGQGDVVTWHLRKVE